MGAYVDTAPWVSGYKRATKRSAKQAGYYHNLSRGWTQGEEQDWSIPKMPKKRRVRLANGRYVYTYDDPYSLSDSYEFNKDNDITQEESNYISAANFNEKYTVEMQGSSDRHDANYKGHIAKLEYAPMRQLMLVTFTNDDSVFVYYRIPSSVYGELYWLAKNNTKQASISDGKMRHAVGIHFWDLIRIRGTLRGGRYKYALYREGTAQRSNYNYNEAQQKMLDAYNAYMSDDSLSASISNDLNASAEALKGMKKDNKALHKKYHEIISTPGFNYNNDLIEEYLDNIFYAGSFAKAIENKYDSLQGDIEAKFNFMIDNVPGFTGISI